VLREAREGSKVTGGAPVVLVVASDGETRRFIRVALAASGYGVLEASNAAQGAALAARHRPDLVVVDLSFPQSDRADGAEGAEVVRRMRLSSHVPILAFSAAGDEGEKARALGEGATDYLAKPFDPPELVSRVRVALGKSLPLDEAAPGVVDLGDDIHVDLPARNVTVRGRPVHLTPVEFKLLSALIENIGSIVPYERLLVAVWGPGHTQQVQSLRVHMTQLRQKLERRPARPEYLLTETGVGYRVRHGQ
jgi:two-component system KDP operon response regulator KdpE